MKIKRYLSIFFMIVFCFLMQTTVLSHFKLTNIIPNLLVIMTSASGFMFGRRYGMFAGVICGGLMDLIYGDVVGVCIFIFVLIVIAKHVITLFQNNPRFAFLLPLMFS